MIIALFVLLLQLVVAVHVPEHVTLHVWYRNRYISELRRTIIVRKSSARRDWRHLAHAFYAIGTIAGSLTQFVA